MNTPGTGGIRRTGRAEAREVRVDLDLAIETVRAEAVRGVGTWPVEARAAWEREEARIDEAMGEIVALLRILEDAGRGGSCALPVAPREQDGRPGPS